jgi:hypothetical protein
VNKKLKLWTGIGTYALVSVGAVSPALSESTVEDYRSLPDDQVSTLLSQSDACVAIPVEGGGEEAYKLPSGAMIVYPSSALHRVETVTAGHRLAAVSWVQSLIRDPAEREILFDLDTVRQALFEQSGKTREFDLLSKTHANLLRKWTEC